MHALTSVHEPNVSCVSLVQQSQHVLLHILMRTRQSGCVSTGDPRKKEWHGQRCAYVIRPYPAGTPLSPCSCGSLWSPARALHQRRPHRCHAGAPPRSGGAALPGAPQYGQGFQDLQKPPPAPCAGVCQRLQRPAERRLLACPTLHISRNVRIAHPTMDYLHRQPKPFSQCIRHVRSGCKTATGSTL